MRSIISRISSSILRQVMALIRKAYQEYERIRSKGNTVRIGTFFRFYFNLEPVCARYLNSFISAN